jgi:hypothetical protein
MRPIFIDGPLKGKDMEVERFPIQVAEPLPRAHSYFNPEFDPLIDLPVNITNYYLHRVAFGNRIIAVASTDVIPPSDDQLFKILFTRRARAAVMT